MRLSRPVAVIVALSGATLAGCGYNTIPANEDRARAEWANVQNQYQRRADLASNLVRAVEAAAASERGILTEVIEAHTRASAIAVMPETLNDPAAFQQYQEAQTQLSQALSRLLLVVERFPQILSNHNFLTLQAQLEGRAQGIAVARRAYNEAARAHNRALRTFPTVIWSNTLHSGAAPLPEFTAVAEAHAAPPVDLSVGKADPTTAPGPAPTPPGDVGSGAAGA